MGMVRCGTCGVSWVVTDDGELPCGCGQRVERGWAPGTAKRFARPVIAPQRRGERPAPPPARGGTPKDPWSARRRTLHRL